MKLKLTTKYVLLLYLVLYLDCLKKSLNANIFFYLSAGIRDPHERAQPGARTPPRERRGDIGAEGGEEQHQGKHITLVTLHIISQSNQRVST